MLKFICDKWTLLLYCLFITEDASLLPCPKSSFQAQADRGRFIIDEYRNSAKHSSVNHVDANLCFTTTIPGYVPLLSSNLSKLYFAQPKNLLVFFHRYIISQSYLVFFLSAQGAGRQCCYTERGNLKLGLPTGGSLNRFNTEAGVPTFSHFFQDHVPFVDCCLSSDKCERYFEKRPSDDGSRYKPPRPGEETTQKKSPRWG